MMGRALREAVADLRANGGDRGYGEVVNDGGLDPDTGQGVASTHWHQGAAAARVSVDEETGRVTVERLHGVAYAGRVVDRAGRRAAERGLDDHGPRHRAVRGDRVRRRAGRERQPVRLQPARGRRPAGGFTHELIEREGAEAHGLGETALPPVPPAIGNALASLGVDVHELPMTPERVLEASG